MKLSPIQQDAYNELKKSNGWTIVCEILDKVIREECNLDDVDEKLTPEEYKSECIGKKIAKRMFKSVFGEIEYLNKEVEKSKKDFS